MTVETINGGDQQKAIKDKAIANFVSLIDDESLSESDYNLDIGGEALSEFRTLCNQNFDQFYSDLSVAAVASSVILTIDTLPTAGDTITVGLTTYTYRAEAAAEGEITIGEAVANTLANTINAINGQDDFNGWNSIVLATLNPVDDTIVITATTAGADGNSIDSTETFTAETNVFSEDTLTGGVTAVPAAAMENYISLNGGDSWYTVRTKLNTLFTMVDTEINGA